MHQILAVNVWQDLITHVCNTLDKEDADQFFYTYFELSSVLRCKLL